MSEFILNRNQYLELEKLGLGAFAPLQGFMNEDDFNSVVTNMRLKDGTPYTIPVVLDVSEKDAERFKGGSSVTLIFEGEEVGSVSPESIYRPDKEAEIVDIFLTDERAHPGVNHFMNMGEVFIGGPVTLKKRVPLDVSEYEMTPEQTKAKFSDMGLETIVGFQTRNVPHRAHEYLQRVALEHVDGLFIQPLVGFKKLGDYTPQAIMKSYRKLIDDFYPKERVVLGTLSTAMRYAGPREAVFHAIIRRNYGCTHFIVGRDHAGVGSYYGKYDAHNLVKKFDGELGIKVMRLKGPYYCAKCDGAVTEHTCPHEATSPDDVTHISGTDMRAMLLGGKKPDKHLMRPEIIDCLKNTPLFVEE